MDSPEARKTRVLTRVESLAAELATAMSTLKASA